MSRHYYRRRRTISTTTSFESAFILVGFLLVLNVIAFWGIWH